MQTLESIESKTQTLQQEKGFNAYVEHVEQNGHEPSDSDFISFYAHWCYEEGRFNDINESNFETEQEERWDI